MEDPTSLQAFPNPAVPPGGWIRAMRERSALPQSELAARFGCTRQAWAQFETSEARGAISLTSLRRAADALGCTFTYALIPREGRGEEAPSVATVEVASPPPVPAGPEREDGARSFASEPDLPTELL